MARIFVGNLYFGAHEDDVRKLFSQFGEVHDLTMPLDQEGRPRGFALVTMGAGEAAIAVSAQI
jgi:RNA recognition motif-containing protein